MFVALIIQHAHAPYCHLWPVRLYNIFPHYLINGAILEKKNYLTHNVCFDFLYNFCLKVSHSKKNLVRYNKKIRVGLHVKYLLFLYDFNPLALEVDI